MLPFLDNHNIFRGRRIKKIQIDWMSKIVAYFNSAPGENKFDFSGTLWITVHFRRTLQ